MKTTYYRIGGLLLMASGSLHGAFESSPIEVPPLRFSDQQEAEIALPEFEAAEEAPRLQSTESKRIWRMPSVRVDEIVDHKLLVKEPDSSIGYTLLVREADLSSE